MTNQIITSKANIINPYEYRKIIRKINPKLEIQWDGSSWVDESNYVISVIGNEQLWKKKGEGIASTLDIELDNATERFTPQNTSSSLYGYLKPRVGIRFSFNIGGQTIRMFTGYIKNIHPNLKTRICSLECFDNQVLVYNKKTQGEVYEDHRTDELLKILAELANLTESQYEFDEGEHIINYGYFENRNVWPVMGEIAVAERGRIFFDRNGILKFWNRNRLHNQEANSLNLTLNDWIKNIDYSVAEHEIKNIVTVRAAPRASAGMQVVWTNGNAEYLNPYNDTLIWIPAGRSQLAFLELEDPCSTFITPVANTDYIANSTQDGSGDDLTSNIKIHEFIEYGDAVYINVLNTGNTSAYLTKFQIRGNPVRVMKWIEKTVRDESSVNRYDEQRFKIENRFIQSEATAEAIAREELWRKKESINLFEIDIIGIPELLCGDVVNVEYREGNFEKYLINELNWTFDDKGFREKLTLVNPYIFPEIETVYARANIVKTEVIETINAKGNIS